MTDFANHALPADPNNAYKAGTTRGYANIGIFTECGGLLSLVDVIFTRHRTMLTLKLKNFFD